MMASREASTLLRLQTCTKDTVCNLACDLILRRTILWQHVSQSQLLYKLTHVHSKGSVVRISPDELHVNDPEFINELYGGVSTKRDRYEFAARQFGLGFYPGYRIASD